MSRDEITSLIEDKVAETLQRTLPDILKRTFVAPEGSRLTDIVMDGESTPKRAKSDDSNSISVINNSRTDRYYTPVQETTLPDELLSFLKSAFTKQLSKDVWSNVMQQYPDRRLRELLIFWFPRLCSQG